MANILKGPLTGRDPLAYLPNFVYKVWNTILGVNPTPLLYNFCEYLDGGYLEQLQEAERSGDEQARKILMAFRGAAKSWTTTSFAVCTLRRDRSEQVLCVSATSKFAGDISQFAYRMVTTFDWLADMKPRADQRQSAFSFDVNGAPVQKDASFTSEGLFGQITGKRATRIIGDDLEVPNTSDTESARANLRRRMAEFDAILVAGRPGGIYLLGTAQTEDTVYREWADERGFELRIYPVQYPRITDPQNDERRHYGTRLAPMIREAVEANPALGGTSTEPTRFTDADLARRKKGWGNTEWERQFLMRMDAGQGKGNPLKLRDLVLLELAPPTHSSPQLKLPVEVQWSPTPAHRLEGIDVDALTGDSALYSPASMDVWLEVEETITFIDTSGEGSDETTWTTCAGLMGRVALLHQGHSTQGSTAEVMEAIAADMKKWKSKKAIIEANFGGSMFGQLLTPKLQDIQWEAAVETIPAGATMKEKRIVETLEPVITDHRLLVNAQVLRDDYLVDYPDVEERDRRFYRLTYQLTRMVKVKGAVRHDDRADGLAGAVRHFLDTIQRQIKTENEEGRLKRLDKQVEELIESRRKQGLPLFGLDDKERSFARPSSRTPLVGSTRDFLEGVPSYTVKL